MHDWFSRVVCLDLDGRPGTERRAHDPEMEKPSRMHQRRLERRHVREERELRGKKTTPTTVLFCKSGEAVQRRSSLRQAPILMLWRILRMRRTMLKCQHRMFKGAWRSRRVSWIEMGIFETTTRNITDGIPQGVRHFETSL